MFHDAHLLYSGARKELPRDPLARCPQDSGATDSGTLTGLLGEGGLSTRVDQAGRPAFDRLRVAECGGSDRSLPSRKSVARDRDWSMTRGVRSQRNVAGNWAATCAFVNSRWVATWTFESTASWTFT